MHLFANCKALTEVLYGLVYISTRPSHASHLGAHDALAATITNFVGNRETELKEVFRLIPVSLSPCDATQVAQGFALSTTISYRATYRKTLKEDLAGS